MQWGSNTRMCTWFSTLVVGSDQVDAPRVRYQRLLPEAESEREAIGRACRGGLEPLDELPTPMSLTNEVEGEGREGGEGEESGTAANWKGNLARQLALDESRSENESPLAPLSGFGPGPGHGQQFFGHKMPTGIHKTASTDDGGEFKPRWDYILVFDCVIYYQIKLLVYQIDF